MKDDPRLTLLAQAEAVMKDPRFTADVQRLLIDWNEGTDWDTTSVWDACRELGLHEVEPGEEDTGAVRHTQLASEVIRLLAAEQRTQLEVLSARCEAWDREFREMAAYRATQHDAALAEAERLRQALRLVTTNAKHAINEVLSGNHLPPFGAAALRNELQVCMSNIDVTLSRVTALGTITTTAPKPDTSVPALLWLDSQTWNAFALIPVHAARDLALEYGKRIKGEPSSAEETLKRREYACVQADLARNTNEGEPNDAT